MFTANQSTRLEAANKLVEAREALQSTAGLVVITQEGGTSPFLDRKVILQCVQEIDTILARLIPNKEINNDLTPTRGQNMKSYVIQINEAQLSILVRGTHLVSVTTSETMEVREEAESLLGMLSSDLESSEEGALNDLRL